MLVVCTRISFSHLFQQVNPFVCIHFSGKEIWPLRYDSALNTAYEKKPRLFYIYSIEYNSGVYTSEGQFVGTVL